MRRPCFARVEACVSDKCEICFGSALDARARGEDLFVFSECIPAPAAHLCYKGCCLIVEGDGGSQCGDDCTVVAAGNCFPPYFEGASPGGFAVEDGRLGGVDVQPVPR